MGLQGMRIVRMAIARIPSRKRALAMFGCVPVRGYGDHWTWDRSLKLVKQVFTLGPREPVSRSGRYDNQIDRILLAKSFDLGCEIAGLH